MAMHNDSKLMQTVKTVAAVGIPAVAYTGLSTMALDRTSLPEGTKGGIGAGVGIFGGLALGVVFPRIGAGVMVGGVITGTAALVKSARYRNYMNGLTAPKAPATAQQAAAAQQTGSATGGSALGNAAAPAGLPAARPVDYSPRSPVAAPAGRARY